VTSKKTLKATSRHEYELKNNFYSHALEGCSSWVFAELVAFEEGKKKKCATHTWRRNISYVILINDLSKVSEKSM